MASAVSREAEAASDATERPSERSLSGGYHGITRRTDMINPNLRCEIRTVLRVLVLPLVALPLLAMPSAALSGRGFSPTFRFDLAAGSINGHALLGKRISVVRRALGTPSAYTLHERAGFLRYGPRSGHVSIMFRLRGGALRATHIAITSADAKEARTRRILRVDPWLLQRRITRAYASTFRLVRPYGCDQRLGACTGFFKRRNGRTSLEFGELGTNRYLLLST